jgi:hypothetical protein
VQKHERGEEQGRNVNNLLHRRIQEKSTIEKRVLQSGKTTRIKRNPLQKQLPQGIIPSLEG